MQKVGLAAEEACGTSKDVTTHFPFLHRGSTTAFKLESES